MKILKIRLENLNSLKGTHEVDLTAEPLASSGIFAITGPTGAGKTTLLDAVTLALYGKVARYGNESNPENVMSRHCGECSAEVEFEVPSGIYRAVWQRRRARKNPSGAMQPPSRYIYDSADQPLTQRIREAEEKIEELLGLNYDRFLRSVLLAQGDFARFLTAKPDERAELLESLTGTEIYSRLSRLAHTEANTKEQELREKEAGLEQLTILEPDARMQLEHAIRSGEKERDDIGRKLEEGVSTLAKIGNLERALKQAKAAADDLTAIEDDQKHALEDLARLRRHRLTVPYEAGLIRLETAAASAGEAEAQHEVASNAHKFAVAELGSAHNALWIVADSNLTMLRETAKSADETMNKTSKSATEARAWLAEHQSDAGLADTQGDLLAAITNLKTSRESLATAWETWKKSAHEILTAFPSGLPDALELKPRTELETLFDAFSTHAEAEGQRLTELRDEAHRQQRLRQDHLEKSRLVANLEDQRRTLKAGEPCALCGALEHPFTKHGAPETKISELESEVEAANNQHTDAAEVLRAFRATSQWLEKSRTDIHDKVGLVEDGKTHLRILLEPLGLAVPEPNGEGELWTNLQVRERAYRQRMDAERTAANEAVAAARTMEEATGKANELEERMLRLTPPSSDLGRAADQELPPLHVVEQAFNDAISEENARGAQLKDRAADAEKAKEKLRDAEFALQEAMNASEFSTLEALRDARLSEEDVTRVESVEAAIKTRETEANTLLKHAQHDIRILRDEHIFEGELAETFRAAQTQLAETRDDLLNTLTTNKNELKSDDERRQQREKKEVELKDDRQQLTVWRRLRELIGSHDGGKFRRYAQAISLDILARHANRHLIRLSDRYRIRRDPEVELNLQIEDLYQGDVRRPMASLSGGESFLVSLSLALGLSDLAGRTVRIDSLFIDEGFGTLDPETLEIALTALESLRQSGKTVGVISHVGLLKERIATQIVVCRKAGGVSEICVIPSFSKA